MSKKFISYEESLARLESLDFGSKRKRGVPLSESLGKILAEDVVALKNDPEFPTASMDGYAIRYADQELGVLRLLGDNPAGHDERRIVQEGECIKTFTGSKMPQGADTLIPIENVRCEGKTVYIEEKVPQVFAVRPVGEGYKAGEVLIQKGTKIGFVEIGVMAALGIVMVDVALEPRVAVLATGSEILDLGECSDNPAAIRSSNNYTIEALCKNAGAEVLQMGTVKDDKQSILKSMQQAVESADIVVSTGGVSVGDYDFVKDIVPALGFEILFQGVAIKPGRHILVAKKEKKVILALPGFAYSSTVTAILYVLPLIAKMLGSDTAYKIVEATLGEDFTKRTPFSEFRACNLTLEDGCYMCDFQGKKVGSSAILVNMLGGAGLMIAGQDDAFLPKGTKVNVLTLEGY